MHRRALGIAVVFLMAACRGSAPSLPEELPGGAEPAAAADNGAAAVQATGAMELSLYDLRPAEPGRRSAVFTMRSPNFTLTSDGKNFARDAEAIVYGSALEDGSRSQDIHLRFGEGYLDQEAERAYLEGGVMLERGDLRIEAERIEWNNEAQRIESQAPVTLFSGEGSLTASSMTLDPRNSELTLTEPRGIVDLQHMDYF